MTMLEIRKVSVRFGGLTAVDDVSLAVPEGTIMGIIGPNGAGKTTLFNVVAGILRPRTGSVLLGGEDITRLPAHRRARRGLARTFQRLEVFGTLSVRENLLVAAESRRRWDRSTQPAFVADELCAELGLGEVAESLVDTLPTGTQRLVELGRALALRPRLLLLDEASSGLTELETIQVGERLQRLAGQGLTVVLVEHDMPFVLSTCGRVAMLDHGVLVTEGTPDEVRNNPVVQEAYLGRNREAAA
ncbi:ABC transporter ATP-binding protein [Frankia sp. CNm7]|uniref:ABC transporter ATP-binding protein n=1 Tax=Frankia nepalensis TaxID=1836974 RepID=A0A937UUJ1_9ACTN|nr:ABC transporter ATP-binding protein [Frankia nepalensis]MBL7495071.1 ABC transporter ATP-binding protein [Frankia nepalensis]MBL7515327.1 ABC transporter ATP-binding protein [Frankia nepalensis]MBL7522314.1 ABC transporter ATP-binding protein [Frankia nepalensis]MBL7632310.1 ABC transporter ATP-binding protein [Frankia nepalensis]